jgi:hypothetical protein
MAMTVAPSPTMEPGDLITYGFDGETSEIVRVTDVRGNVTLTVRYLHGPRIEALRFFVERFVLWPVRRVWRRFK